MMKDTIHKAGGTDTDTLLAALQDAKFETISGQVIMRAVDHQSTLGAWVGETTQKDKQGPMKNWKYEDGAKYTFPEAEVKAVRKDEARAVPGSNHTMSWAGLSRPSIPRRFPAG